jgi:ABC-type transport system involved in multi-copper enzyme maturation permease subunit
MSFSSFSHSQSQPKYQFWQRSFFNLLQRELNQWLPNYRKFWLAILTWTIVTYVVSGIWFQSSNDVAPPPYTSIISGWLFVSSMRGVFSLQGIISEEKLTGTLAWILSKPVPRSACREYW